MPLRRETMLVAAFFLSAPALGDETSAKAEIALLGHADYAVREAAQQRLVQSDESAFGPVVEAVGRRGEVGERAATVLTAWAFGGEDEFADRCERELYRLADRGTPAESTRAKTVLSANRTVRVRRGLNRLAELGATCACFEPYLAPKDGFRPPRPGEGGPAVVLEKPFSGTVEDLWLLRRFSDVPNVAVYSAMRELNDAAVAAATADLTGVQVHPRGGALAIVSNGAASPCRIGAVKPGEAADRAGLGAGDIILKMNETEIDKFTDLVDALYPLAWDDEVTLRVQRDRVIAEVDVTLSKWADMASTLNRNGGREYQPRKSGIPKTWRIVGTAPVQPVEDPFNPIFRPRQGIFPPPNRQPRPNDAELQRKLRQLLQERQPPPQAVEPPVDEK